MLVFASEDRGIKEMIPPTTVQMSRKYIQEASPGSARLLSLFRLEWARRLVRMLEHITIPGMTLHYVVRKLHLENVVRQGLRDGYIHLVVLGAGFDTLTQRLADEAEFRPMSMVEVDYPATERIKTKVLGGMRFNRQVRYVSSDIGNADLNALMRECRAEVEGARTIVLAEGLLMYFEPSVVSSLIRAIRSEFGPEVRVAFTFMEPQAGGRIAFKRQSRSVDYWLRHRGESFRWGIPASNVAAFLAQHGLRSLELMDKDRFTEAYLKPRHLTRAYLADGDHLCVAEGLTDRSI